MKQTESADFFLFMNGIAIMYGKEFAPIRQIYWEALEDYELIDVKFAISKYITDRDLCNFFPKPGNIIFLLPKKEKQFNLHRYRCAMKGCAEWGSICNTIHGEGKWYCRLHIHDDALNPTLVK